MQIEIGKNRPALLGLGRKMLAAIIRFLKPGPERIDLKQSDEAKFRADYDAATGAEDAFQRARFERSECIAARRTQEEEAGRFIGRCKDLLADEPGFGPRWNLAWVQAGFKSPGTIETPADVDGKLEVLRSLATYFSGHPELEVDTPKLQITHLKAGKLEKALADAVNEINTCHTKVDKAATAREQAEEALKQRMRVVIDELSFLLGDMDARWVSFGLNKPGETQRPDQPQNVQASTPSPRVLALTWEPSARASRYKVRAQVTGRDQEFETVTEVFEPHVDLNTFEPGQTVRVEIVAVNGAGDSAPSQPVEKPITGQAAAA